MKIKTLDLGNNSLTLNSASSDLRINNSLTLDHENEKLICGNADLEFTGLLNISLGEVSSDNGKIQLDKGHPQWRELRSSQLYPGSRQSVQ